MTIFEIEYSSGSVIEWVAENAGMMSDDECFEAALAYAINKRNKNEWIVRVECIAC